MAALEGGACDAMGLSRKWGWDGGGKGRGGRGVESGGPAQSLGTAGAATATAVAAALWDPRRCADERLFCFAERWEDGEKTGKLIGLRREQGRAGKGGRSRGLTSERGRIDGGTEASAGPARAKARVGPCRAGDAGWAAGRLRGQGYGAAVRGRNARQKLEGQVLLSPSFTGACGLGWGPAVEIRAAAEGRVVRRGAGRSPASPAVGRRGAGNWLLLVRVSTQGGYPPLQRAPLGLPTHLPISGWKSF